MVCDECRGRLPLRGRDMESDLGTSARVINVILRAVGSLSGLGVARRPEGSHIFEIGDPHLHRTRGAPQVRTSDLRVLREPGKGCMVLRACEQTPNRPTRGFLRGWRAANGPHHRPLPRQVCQLRGCRGSAGGGEVI